MVTIIAVLTEKQILQMIILRLRGRAQQWATESLKTEVDIEPKKFFEILQKRLSNEREKPNLLNKFLVAKAAKSKDELRILLEISNKIHGKIVIEERGLVKLIIARVPDTIKAFFFQVSATEDWWGFSKAVEESTRLCLTSDTGEDKLDITLRDVC